MKKKNGCEKVNRVYYYREIMCNQENMLCDCFNDLEYDLISHTVSAIKETGFLTAFWVLRTKCTESSRFNLHIWSTAVGRSWIKMELWIKWMVALGMC